MTKPVRKSRNRVFHGDDNVASILTIIGQIPKGKVATYGQIARLAGIPRNARQVGYALKTLPAGMDVPWYRVVNSRGEISERRSESSQLSQRAALESEGIVFDANGRIALNEFGWRRGQKK